MDFARGHVLVCGGTGCTSSGSEQIIKEMEARLKENGLEVVEDVAKVSARLIVNTVSMKLRQNEIESLIAKIENEINK